MAMPQRDNYIEELRRLEGYFDYAVAHGETAEVERIRERMKKSLEKK